MKIMRLCVLTIASLLLLQIPAFSQDVGPLTITVSGAYTTSDQNYYVVQLPDSGDAATTIQITGDGDLPDLTDDMYCTCPYSYESAAPNTDGDPVYTFENDQGVGTQDGDSTGQDISWDVSSGTAPGEYKFALQDITQFYDSCDGDNWDPAGEETIQENSHASPTITILVAQVYCSEFDLNANGRNGLKVNLKPSSQSGTLKVDLNDSAYNLFNKSTTGSDSDLKPVLNWGALPNSKVVFKNFKATWTVHGVDLSSTLDDTTTFVGTQSCTGYFTTCNSAYTGGNNNMYDGSTAISVHQSFLDANVVVRSGAAYVIEGVGVLNNNAITYYHFAQSQQVLNSQKTQIAKYVVTHNGSDGNCNGGHALSANWSVAKKNSSAFYSCGDNIYIMSTDQSPDDGQHVVEDNGHTIDTPDVFNGQGNSSLDYEHGDNYVFIN
jgi:hypothetical protein